MSDLSTTTINGEPQTWEQLYERTKEENRRLQKWARICNDLDRCEHGRHERDECSGCGGPSLGNPRLRDDHTPLGYSLDGLPIYLPSRRHRHDPDHWIPQTRGQR